MEVTINTEYITLSALLKLSGIAKTGGEAKIMVQDGRVKVNGETETRRGRKLYEGDRVEVLQNPPVTILVKRDVY